MKKLIGLILALTMTVTLIGCESKKDYPAAIMVDGVVYLYSAEAILGEVDESEIIGYTTSYTDTFPENDGETNFNRELKMPYAKVKEGIAVLNNNEWHLCVIQE